MTNNNTETHSFGWMNLCLVCVCVCMQTAMTSDFHLFCLSEQVQEVDSLPSDRNTQRPTKTIKHDTRVSMLNTFRFRSLSMLANSEYTKMTYIATHIGFSYA